MRGMILKGVGGLYHVLTENGDLVRCAARGRFRLQENTPYPGDHVRVSKERKNEIALIEEILPRKNVFIRPPVANMDLAVLVLAFSDPMPDLLLLDRMLLQADFVGAEVKLCFNKQDLAERQQILSLKQEYAAFDPLVICAATGEGLQGLLQCMAEKVAFVSGPSGAGKSTLLNALLGQCLQTGEVSAKIGRGRHTTRHAELLPLPQGGFVADTPGFGLLENVLIPPQDLQHCYPEFEPFIGKCKYSSCVHDQEPQCAVRSAVEDNIIPSGRHMRYRTILKEMQQSWRKQYDA